MDRLDGIKPGADAMWVSGWRVVASVAVPATLMSALAGPALRAFRAFGLAVRADQSARRPTRGSRAVGIRLV